MGINTLGSSPKMLGRGLEPPGGSIYMYYGVSYHMFAFLFERTFLVIHCKTHLWSLLLTLMGSWTAPSLWSRYGISLRYISYFIFLLLCFFTSCSIWSLLLTQIFGWCFYKFLQLLLWFQQSAYQIIHPFFFKFIFFLSNVTFLFIHNCFVFYFLCD